MKKLLFILAFVVGVFAAANAQPRAIGGRLGYGLNATYQHSFGEKNMLQLDLGIPGFYGVQAVGTYNWLFPIKNWTPKGTWNWYAGVGGGVGIGLSSWFSIGVAGMVGLEYTFASMPLTLSVDYRPVIGPSFATGGAYFGSGDFYAGAFGLSAKFRF